MKLQTSALRARMTAATIAGVLLGMILAGGAARAQSVAEISPGMMASKGWYLIAIPPIQAIDGRRVVVASAPESEWTVKLGPFLDIFDCSHSLSSYSKGTLLESDYEAYKAGGSFSVKETEILEDVQQRNAKCVVSDGISERFRTPGRFEKDPTTGFVR